MTSVPPLIEMADIAAACGMRDAQAAKREMQRAGIAQKIGGRWKVDDSRLREVLPSVYDRVWMWFRNGQKRAETG